MHRVLPAMVLLAAALTLLWGRPAPAAEVKVLTAGAFKPVVSALAPELARQTGDTVAVVTDTAGGVLRRAGAGEAFDLVVLTRAGLAELAATGRVAAGTVRDLARVGVGVAVRAGAPRPDIGTVDAFRRALLDASSVAYIDPAAGGSSGVYVARLLDHLGIAGAVRAKAVLSCPAA